MTVTDVLGYNPAAKSRPAKEGEASAAVSLLKRSRGETI